MLRRPCRVTRGIFEWLRVDYDEINNSIVFFFLLHSTELSSMTLFARRSYSDMRMLHQVYSVILFRRNLGWCYRFSIGEYIKMGQLASIFMFVSSFTG